VDIGLVGGMVGGLIGVAGGLVGTYFSIKNTAGARERSFMIRVSAIAWLMIAAFLAGLLLLPKPYNWLLWVPYAIALPLSIRWLNQRQRQIRAEESALRGSSSARA
jgi:hypothetical protein